MSSAIARIWLYIMSPWVTGPRMIFCFILEQTGPAKVSSRPGQYLSMPSASYNMIEDGMILELKGIFDYRNGTRKPAELQFLQKITTEIKPAKCHAKVTVIVNDSWGICVVGMPILPATHVLKPMFYAQSGMWRNFTGTGF